MGVLIGTGKQSLGDLLAISQDTLCRRVKDFPILAADIKEAEGAAYSAYAGYYMPAVGFCYWEIIKDDLEPERDEVLKFSYYNRHAPWYPYLALLMPLQKGLSLSPEGSLVFELRRGEDKTSVSNVKIRLRSVEYKRTLHKPGIIFGDVLGEYELKGISTKFGEFVIPLGKKGFGLESPISSDNILVEIIVEGNVTGVLYVDDVFLRK
ncbi:MAG: hypothetical protein NC834_05335 [Candidatus Omnitrophica bacterium]|nr:hypothetical protein [Candidatus Omnitrophota bacterium]